MGDLAARFRGRRAVAGGILCASLLGAAPVAADQATRRDADDVRSFLDIAKVSHHHVRLQDGRRRVIHTISMHEKWSSRWLYRSGCGDLSIWIDDPGRIIQIFRSNGELRARLGQRQLPVWRPDRRSIAVRARPRALAGDDGTYRWRARSLATQDPSCEGGTRGWEDYAPNERWIRHDLH